MIFKSFTIYTGTNFINQAIPFLFLPILTRFLTPADYGILSTFTAILGVVTVFISMGSTDAITRAYFDRHEKDFNFSSFMFNALIINFTAFLIIFGITFCLKSFISKKLFIPSNWVLLLPIIGFCSVISSITLKMFVYRKKPFSYLFLKLSDTMIEILLSVFLVVVIGLSWKGRIVGISVSSFLFLLIGLYILFSKYISNLLLNSQYAKQIISYGTPIFFHSVGLTVIMAMDRFFLNRFAGLSETGLYSVAYSISSVIAFIILAFGLAWNPVLYERLNAASQALKIKLVRFTYSYLAVLFLLALLLSIFSPYIIRILVGARFYGSSQFIFWLSMGWVMYGMNIMTLSYIYYSKKTYFLYIIALVSIVVNAVLNYIFIKLNGPIGAAQAMFLTFLSRAVLTWYFSHRAYPMPWFSFAIAKT
ncbi:MAG: oligosaccharide flippase family protein [Candidatus Omnitrophica bacterium]|nr:oligosaccharide flippase family protein [Candidatus Omnitrophota bacterium]